MINIWQDSNTKIDFQLLDEDNIPKDLTNITKVEFEVGIKKNQKKLFTCEGTLSSPIDGKLTFNIIPSLIPPLTPKEVFVPTIRLYKPTATLYGYIDLYEDETIIDKIFIEDIAIYFTMVN